MFRADGIRVGAQGFQEGSDTVIGELLVSDLGERCKLATTSGPALRGQVGHLVPSEDGTGSTQVVDRGESGAQLIEFGRGVVGVVRHVSLLGRDRSRARYVTGEV